MVQYGAGVTREVMCPKTMVGRVIGKGGETIKTLQKNFGANIQIDQTVDPMKITIAGQPSAVEAAAAAVTEIVNGGNPYLGPSAPGAYGASYVCLPLLLLPLLQLPCGLLVSCHVCMIRYLPPAAGALCIWAPA